MRKGVLAVLLIAIALAVAGCKGGGKGPASSDTTPFIGGTEGLTMKFAENSPPSEVTDAQMSGGKPVNTFDIIMLMENIGESDVQKAGSHITISGISASDFLKTTTAGGKVVTVNVDGQEVLLKGKNPESSLDGVKKDPDGNKIPGSVADVQFTNLAYQRQLQGNNEFPIQADLCYTYQTKAATDVCIRADATKRVSGVCQIAEQKQVFSSGAPVHVTSVKESVGGRNKVLLTFNVKNVGSGSVFKVDKTIPVTECDKTQFSKQDQVLVGVITGMPGISCSGLTGGTADPTGKFTGYLRLSGGEGTFSCIQATANEDAVKKVDLKLDYNYLVSRNTKILVKHLLGEPDTGGQADGQQGGAQQQQQASNPNTNPRYSDVMGKCTSSGGQWDSVALTCNCGSLKWNYYPAGCTAAIPPLPPVPPLCLVGQVKDCGSGNVEVCQAGVGQWTGKCGARS